ncbi:MAG: SGNH/GDSL hydrolase family protein [Nakamurella sp.]
MGSRRLALVVASAALLLVGCSESRPAVEPPTPSSPRASEPEPTTPDFPTVDTYVAIGDSFTAGPGLADLQAGSGRCLRSTRNWPSLLARQLGPRDFDDVSCAGASTAGVLRGGGLTGSAQIDAVSSGTDLVTVGVGGNDGNLFASLISACTGGDGACGAFARDRAPVILDETASRITEVLEGVRANAPAATVLLVGYLAIMPESGTCEAIGIPEGDAAAVVRTEDALDEALATAADRAGVGYVSMRTTSRGHDACAGRAAWTNGRAMSDDDGIVFHPRLAGMRAVANAVAAELAG